MRYFEATPKAGRLPVKVHKHSLTGKKQLSGYGLKTSLCIPSTLTYFGNLFTALMSLVIIETGLFLCVVTGIPHPSKDNAQFVFT
jgi:hypothetical protein